MADSDPSRVIPPQPNGWWDQLSEQRLNFVVQRLNEVAGNLAETAKELRAQVRISDKQGSDIERLEERSRDAQRDLEDLRKGLDRLASADAILRLEKRVEAIEDEGKSPFVRKTEFDPVKKVVFGLVTTFFLAVVGGLMKLVLK